MQTRSGLASSTAVGRLRFFAPTWLLLLVGLLSVLTACAPTAGIFASGTWQASGLQNEHLQVLAVDPAHLRNIYAGDAQNGVFASTDAGISWKPSSVGLPLPLAIYALSFDISGKKLYAATSRGLFVSTNAAQSWQAVAPLPSDAYTSLAFDSNSPQTIYVGTAHNGALKSSDDGTTWTGMSAGLPAGEKVTCVLYDSNLKQLWTAFAQAIYRSDDGGISWKRMDTGLPSNVGINTLANGEVTVATGSLIFAGTEHGFYLSTDDGQHWVQSQSSLSDLHISSILVDATQANKVYISTDIGVLSTQDNGQHWASVASGLPAGQPINGLAQGATSYAQLFVATRGIYLYPGSGSNVFDPSRLIPLVLIFLFFVLLYRFFIMRQRRARYRSANAPPAQPGAEKEEK